MLFPNLQFNQMAIQYFSFSKTQKKKPPLLKNFETHHSHNSSNSNININSGDNLDELEKKKKRKGNPVKKKKEKKRKEKEPKPKTSPSCSLRVGWGGGSVDVAGQRGWSVICLDELEKKIKEWKPSEKKKTQAQNFAVMFAMSWMRWGLGQRGWAKRMKCDMLVFGNEEEFLWIGFFVWRKNYWWEVIGGPDLTRHWQWVPMCVFNYKNVIELWVMEIENSQNVFSVSITHN